MHVNGKMRPVETFPGMAEVRIKENDGGGEFNFPHGIRGSTSVSRLRMCAVKQSLGIPDSAVTVTLKLHLWTLLIYLEPRRSGWH
jgi:hypothetical protein